MATPRDLGLIAGPCQYQPQGWVRPFLRFVFLTAACFLAATAGGLFARLPPPTLSRLTGGWTDQLFEKETQSRDANADVLARMAETHAELNAKLETLRKSVEQRPARETTSAQPAAVPSSQVSKDYSQFQIEP